MVDLNHARTIAARPVDDSDDADTLRLLVFELCDELERRSLAAGSGSVS